MFKQMVVNIIFNSVLLYFYNIEKLEVNAQLSKTSGSAHISVKMWKEGIYVNFLDISSVNKTMTKSEYVIRCLYPRLSTNII